ncbi:MAG: Ldh family oxidoreductase [Oscillospiraceae bacterium]
MEERPFVPWELMSAFITDAFKAYGVPEEDAAICADVILESDRRGIASHGCNRLKPIYLDRFENGTLLPVTKIDILKETKTTVVLDANDGLGMVASKKAMDMAIEKAKTYGMGGAAVKNSTHYGIAGYWASMAANAGLISICGTNARPAVAPTGGVDNMLGTNALTISFPTDEEFPFILDCATSTVQRGNIEVWAREGKPTPEGAVIGHDGKYLTDSPQILKDLLSGTAALTPFAGYKGYGYSMVVETLSAALVGGPFMRMLSGIDEDGNSKPYHLGHFFFLIDPEAFLGEDTFRKTAGDICRQLRASTKAPGVDRIYTAGEKEWLNWQERKDKGVPIPPAVQSEILAVRDKLKLPYTFPFEG